MDERTIGEITRTLDRLEISQKDQTAKLDAIKEQTTKTNGTLIYHEGRLNGHDEALRELKRAHAPASAHDLRRVSDRKGAITFTAERNTVITVAIAFGSFLAAMLAAFFGVKLPTL